MVMPRVDRGDDRMLAAVADDRRGIGRQRGDADRGLAGCQRNAARGGKPDPQSGETAGAGGGGDAVERVEADAGFLHHARDQRHQRFGMAPLHRPAIPARSSCRCAVSSTAAAQASSAVSMARISMVRCIASAIAGHGRKALVRAMPASTLLRCQNVDARDKPGHDEQIGSAPLTLASHRPDFDHVGHEVAQQVLDAVLQGRGR